MMKGKIKAKWIIKFPIGSEVLVGLGDKIEEGQVVVVADFNKIESINLSNFFGKYNTNKIKEINEKLKGVWINSGELICLTGGIFPKKLCLPMSGNFIEIDEFGFLKIETKIESKKEVLAPTKSIVSKIEDGRLVLEFEAHEFKGKGIVLGKSWGDVSFEVINEAKDLNSSQKSKIIFTDNLTNGFLLKAEVVGVTGIITKNDIKEEVFTDLPLLRLDKLTWDKLLKYQKVGKRMLINSRLDRVLLVIE